MIESYNINESRLSLMLNNFMEKSFFFNNYNNNMDFF